MMNHIEILSMDRRTAFEFIDSKRQLKLCEKLYGGKRGDVKALYLDGSFVSFGELRPDIIDFFQKTKLWEVLPTPKGLLAREGNVGEVRLIIKADVFGKVMVNCFYNGSIAPKEFVLKGKLDETALKKLRVIAEGLVPNLCQDVKLMGDFRYESYGRLLKETHAYLKKERYNVKQ